jgi:putative hydrolase of the HAD superfamily
VLSSVRAIYFDLDDTLCAYWDACRQGLRETFTSVSVPGHNAQQVSDAWVLAFREFCPNLRDLGFYKKYLVEGGHTRVEQMRRTLGRLEHEDETLAQSLSDTYLERRHDALALFPDALDVLRKLSARYPLGLVTNGPADIQREEIRLLNIADYFTNVFIEGELGFGKPEPEVFRQAAEVVGFQPSELLFVGNSYRHDILPAIQAGWMTAWIRRDSDVPPSAPGISPQPEQLPEGAPKPTLELSELSELLSPLGLA